MKNQTFISLKSILKIQAARAPMISPPYGSVAVEKSSSAVRDS